MRMFGIDPLAPNHRVRQIAKTLGNDASYDSFDPLAAAPIPHMPNFNFRQMTNVRDFVQLRLARLHAANKLVIDGDFGGFVWLALGIDKGEHTTKVSLILGNVRSPNSVNNLMLLAIYNGPDNHEYLYSALNSGNPPLKEQIEDLAANGVVVDGRIRGVRLFVVGDMMCLTHLYGHLGPAATFNCLLCSIPKETLKQTPSAIFPLRNLEAMHHQGVQFEQGLRDGANPTRLSQRWMSIGHRPILEIPLRNVVPSPLHLLMGLAKVLVDGVEAKCRAMLGKRQAGIALAEAYRAIGVDRLPYYQRFSGMYFSKIDQKTYFLF